MDQRPSPRSDSEARNAYTPLARILHWIVAMVFLVQFPVGFAIVQMQPGRAASFLFDFHKLVGLCLFWIVVFRAIYRLRNPARRSALTLARWHRTATLATHITIYVLLLSVPVLGWLGVTALGTQTVFGWFTIPSLISPDAALSSLLLFWHGLLAFMLLAAVFAHIAIAMQGYLENTGELPDSESEPLAPQPAGAARP